MSKLARGLTILVVLAAMSLGGTAHAQATDPDRPPARTPSPGPAGGKGNGGEATPLPDQAGTDQVGAEQAGTELGAADGGGLDPVWLLLPTALLLVLLAVVLRLLHTARLQH